MHLRKSRFGFAICVILLLIAVVLTLLHAAQRSINAAGEVLITLLPISNTGSGVNVTVSIENPNIPPEENNVQIVYEYLIHGKTYSLQTSPGNEVSIYSSSGPSFSSYFTVRDEDMIVPVFLGSSPLDTPYIVIYAQSNVTVTLDLLARSGNDGVNSVEIFSSGTNPVPSERIDGEALSLKKDEFAVIWLAPSVLSYTLNDQHMSVNMSNPLVVLGGGSTDPGHGGKAGLILFLDIAANFSEEKYSAESWLRFESALAAARSVFNAANATDTAIDEAVNELNAAMGALEFTAGYTTRGATVFGDDKAEIAVYPPGGAVIAGSTVVCELRAADAEYISDLVINFKFDPQLLEYEYAEGTNGYSALEAVFDNSAGTGSVTLTHLNASRVDETKFSNIDTISQVARLRFRTKAAAASATVTLLNTSTAAAIDTEGFGADVGVAVTQDKAVFAVEDGTPVSWPNLDLNRDGILSLADLATAQNWYRESKDKNPALWEIAKIADFDGDEVITVADLLMLYAGLRDAGVKF